MKIRVSMPPAMIKGDELTITVNLKRSINLVKAQILAYVHEHSINKVLTKALNIVNIHLIFGARRLEDSDVLKDFIDPKVSN
jgi:hypothetical protein